MKTNFLTVLTLIVLAMTTTNSTAQFVQAPLPYDFTALEPSIDAQTMELHFTKHHAGYVNNLNNALKAEGKESHTDLEAILKDITSYSVAVRNNGGGHYNHQLFWTLLTPKKNTQASAELADAINKHFGNMEEFKTQFNQAAATRFGSGWAWLIVTEEGKLAITSTPNQDNPLMPVAPMQGEPILGVDVWEHAYYLKYQNRRPDYLQAIWDVINWEEVSKLYAAAIK